MGCALLPNPPNDGAELGAEDLSNPPAPRDALVEAPKGPWPVPALLVDPPVNDGALAKIVFPLEPLPKPPKDTLDPVPAEAADVLNAFPLLPPNLNVVDDAVGTAAV